MKYNELKELSGAGGIFIPLISISLKKFILVLVIIVLTINTIGFIGRTVEYLLGYEETTTLVRLFHIGEEGNITSYYSALSLLLSAILLAFIARTKKTAGGAYARHWTILAAIFFYLSLDEAAVIHELACEPLQALFKLSGVFYFAWVIIAIPLLIIFLITYLSFLKHLPQTTRRLFILAGILFVTGALGLEMVEGYYWSGKAVSSLPIVPLLNSVEEIMENFGIVVFIYAILSYMKTHMNMTEIGINIT